jgi:hypothetical protein
VQFSIDTLQVLQSNLLLKDHLVEADDEIRIQEATVEYTEAKASTNKFEVVQMLGIDAGCGVDLESIIVMGRVLEKTVERIEHLVREQEEEFSVSMLAN